MFDFAGLLKDPLLFLSNFVAQHHEAIYLLLFAIIFTETGLIVMPLLPGDSLLFAAGALAASTGELNIGILIPLLITAALLGDNVNYFVGKFFGDLIKSRERILFFKKEYIDQTHEFYERHGGKAVIMARFVPIVRTVAPFVAGAGSMTYTKYLLNCIIGALIWVIGITSLGYALGQNTFVKQNFEKVVFLIIGISVMPMVIGIIKSRMSKN
ncbi:MAG: VTT domain-containing protein [Chitinophagales bacterium]